MCWQTAVAPLPTTLVVAAVCFVDDYFSAVRGQLLVIPAAVLLAFFLLLVVAAAAAAVVVVVVVVGRISWLLRSSSILPISPAPTVFVFLFHAQLLLLCVSSPLQGV